MSGYLTSKEQEKVVLVGITQNNQISTLIYGYNCT